MVGMNTKTIYKWLEPKPYKQHTRQLGIAGRNMTVWNLVAEIVVSERTLEEVAEDYRLPLEAVQEALAYYYANQEWIDVEVEETAAMGPVFNLRLRGGARALIGHRGTTLHALEHVVRSLVFHATGTHPEFRLDVDDYMRKREWYIKEILKSAVAGLAVGKRVALPPMTAFERKFVHTSVQQQYTDIRSSSIGEGDARRVVLHKINL